MIDLIQQDFLVCLPDCSGTEWPLKSIYLKKRDIGRSSASHLLIHSPDARHGPWTRAEAWSWEWGPGKSMQGTPVIWAIAAASQDPHLTGIDRKFKSGARAGNGTQEGW